MLELMTLKERLTHKTTYFLHGYYANFLIKVVLSLI